MQTKKNPIPKMGYGSEKIMGRNKDGDSGFEHGV